MCARNVSLVLKDKKKNAGLPVLMSYKGPSIGGSAGGAGHSRNRCEMTNCKRDVFGKP